MVIKGIVKKDKRTKKLINRLNSGDIALIAHRDIDEIAAYSLVESKVKCVINTKQSISGKYPNQGPKILLEAGIPIFETNSEVFDKINENQIIEIKDNNIISNKKIIAFCNRISSKHIDDMHSLALKNLEVELDKFIENTLDYAKKEKGLVLGKVVIPRIKTKINNRHVLIVVRGKDYKRDLAAIQNYIVEMKPVLIGVDGGGDALLEFGHIPDIVIGDMDSISDRCLKLSNEIIVHAYPNGDSPGLHRIKKLGLEATVFPAPGTSEDIALLLAHYYKADLIVAVGTHSSMIDFLEKGRGGMASTFLVRLKVGSKLVDAKGVNKLYRSNLKLKYLLGLGISALIPIIIISSMSPPIRELIRLIHMRIKFFIGF